MKEPLVFLMLVGAVCTACMTDNLMEFYFTSMYDVPALRRKATYFVISAVGVVLTVITFLKVAKP